MNIDLSPRARSLVSGLAAVVTTSLLMITVVESFTPLLGSETGKAAAPVTTAAVDFHRQTALSRRV